MNIEEIKEELLLEYKSRLGEFLAPQLFGIGEMPMTEEKFYQGVVRGLRISLLALGFSLDTLGELRQTLTNINKVLGEIDGLNGLTTLSYTPENVNKLNAKLSELEALKKKYSTLK